MKNASRLFVATVAMAVAIGQLKGGNKQFYSIVMPGLNGMGGDRFQEHGVINTPYSRYTSVGAEPRSPDVWKRDFGQRHCIEHFHQQYQTDDDAQRGNNIICGVSQGTPTVVNWLARRPVEEQDGMAKCVVLESVLGSPESTIMHRMANLPVSPQLRRLAAAATYLPFSRVWMPFAAKLYEYRAYTPWGENLWSSAEKLSPNIPTVIMHDVNDDLTPINDAREAYCRLASRPGYQGNAYLMELAVAGWPRHIDLLADKPMQQCALQAIYKKHGLPYNTELYRDGTKPESYQPSVKEVKARIHRSSWRSFWARNIIDTATVAMAAHRVLKYFRR